MPPRIRFRPAVPYWFATREIRDPIERRGGCCQVGSPVPNPAYPAALMVGHVNGLRPVVNRPPAYSIASLPHPALRTKRHDRSPVIFRRAERIWPPRSEERRVGKECGSRG